MIRHGLTVGGECIPKVRPPHGLTVISRPQIVAKTGLA